VHLGAIELARPKMVRAVTATLNPTNASAPHLGTPELQCQVWMHPAVRACTLCLEADAVQRTTLYY
jgi:hypothetical protein